MPETRIAKLFKNSASQAVRLLADFRFEGDEAGWARFCAHAVDVIPAWAR